MITIKKYGTATLEEKKSKFIAEAFYIQSKEEAEDIISKVKKKYSDAKHHCYAYIVEEKNQTLTKTNDDGEPSGTAGMPILNVLIKKNISNVLIIVTRYFGGTLLGTGGLVRNYQGSAIKALENAQIVEKERGVLAKITTTYNELEKVKYYLRENKCNIVKIDYEEKINIFTEINVKIYNELEKNSNKQETGIDTVENIELRYIETK